MLQRIDSGRAAPPDLISAAGTFRTKQVELTMSVAEEKADFSFARRNF
jgi:hypothetical protein